MPKAWWQQYLIFGENVRFKKKSQFFGVKMAHNLLGENTRIKFPMFLHQSFSMLTFAYYLLQYIKIQVNKIILT
jgi:hypothetical protein